MNNPKQLTWMNYPLKFSKTAHTCRMCGKQIKKGTLYYDGGDPARKGHSFCVDSIIEDQTRLKKAQEISKQVRAQGGEVAETLAAKCRWEQMSVTAVILCWGDPREWGNNVVYEKQHCGDCGKDGQKCEWSNKYDKKYDTMECIMSSYTTSRNEECEPHAAYRAQKERADRLDKDVKDLKDKIINMGILRNELTNCLLGALGELYKRGVDATPAQESILKRIVGEEGEDLEGR